MKPKVVYVIQWGVYHDDALRLFGVVSSKKKAGQLCRENGYRWNSEEQLFLNDDQRRWVKVYVTELDKLDPSICYRSSNRVSFGKVRKRA